MSAEAYFKAAADNLRRAAQVLKTEADQILKDLNRQELEKKSHINHLKTKERIHEVEVLHAEDSSIQAIMTQRAIAARSEASDVEREIARMREELKRQAADKEGMVTDLMQKANEIESMKC